MKSETKATDEELMLAYLAGDSSAFEELYGRYSARAYSFIRKRVDREEEAEEVFQAVFAKLHRSRRSYDPAYLFSQWLFVMCKTSLLDHWRKSSRRVDLPAVADWEEYAEKASLAVPGAGTLGDAEVAALAELSQEQRKILEMRILEDVPYSEIADRMKRSQESVRQIFSRALRKVQDRLVDRSPADSRSDRSKKR